MPEHLYVKLLANACLRASEELVWNPLYFMTDETNKFKSNKKQVRNFNATLSNCEFSVIS